MLNKLILVHRINKFYNIFWEVLEYGYEFNIRSLDYDSLSGVLFDIYEVLEAYEYDQADDMVKWLVKLNIQITNFQEKTPIDLNRILFKICNTKDHKLRRGTKPLYKLAQYLYKKGVI